MSVVFGEDGGVAGAEPQARRSFPFVLEPDRLGQLDVAVLAGEQPHSAAALDGGQLFLVPGDEHLAVQVVGQAHDPGQLADRHHGRLIDDDQRARRDGQPVAALGIQPGEQFRRVVGVHCQPGPLGGRGQDVAGRLGARDAPHFRRARLPRGDAGGHQGVGLAGSRRAR